ncbi:MAG: hypothetical protein OEV66_05910 [Spirochaetia bacterium]|nr:hypothetical protein [Spirochaetia bacterium]
MSATTIKLDGRILAEIDPYLEKNQTLTSFIRESVQREIKRRKMKLAASSYIKNLEKHKQEKQDLDEWESADLSLESE